jgi:hypothetical protein
LNSAWKIFSVIARSLWCGQKLGSAWKILSVIARSLWCVDKNWAMLGRFFQSLLIPCGVWTKIGQCLEDSFSHYPFLVELVVVSVCVDSAWKILSITARSLWSVLGGGGRESSVKHGTRGASTSERGPIGKASMRGIDEEGPDEGGPTWVGKDQRVHYASGSH